MKRWVAAIAIFIGLVPGALAESLTPPQPDSPAFIVLFDPGSAEISSAAQMVLDQALADYRALKPSVVHVNGYFHDPALVPEEAGRQSRRMAESVRDQLVAKGIPPTAIALRWFVPAGEAPAQPFDRSVDILFDNAKNVLRP